MGKADLRLDPMVDPESAQKKLLAFESLVYILGKKAIFEEFLRATPKGKKRHRKKLAKKWMTQWVADQLYEVGFRRAAV